MKLKSLHYYYYYFMFNYLAKPEGGKDLFHKQTPFMFHVLNGTFDVGNVGSERMHFIPEF